MRMKSSWISWISLRRQMPFSLWVVRRISVDLLQRGEELMGMQLAHVVLGAFPRAGPHDAAAFLMHLKHEAFRMLLRVAKNLPDHQRHVAHEVHRIIVNDHVPRGVELDVRLGAGLRIDSGGL